MAIILRSELLTQSYELKVLINEKGIIFGTTRQEHQSLSSDEIRYAPALEHANALAGFLSRINKTMEFRKDPKFSAARLRRILDTLADELALSSIADYNVLYGGEKLGPFRLESSDDEA